MTSDEIYGHIVRFEGVVPHLYQDVNGYVTVGVGNLVPNELASRKLNLIDRASHKPATPDECAEDYRAVKALMPGMKASHYSHACNLEMSVTEIRRLFDRRVAEFQMQLRAVYPNYDACPGSVQLALLDMAFNLGCGALNERWPLLKAAVTSFNWTDAARHAHRPQSSTARNLATAELFHAAYAG